MCMLGYLKTPNVILFLVSSQKLDWTHTFDTHCIQAMLNLLKHVPCMNTIYIFIRSK